MGFWESALDTTFSLKEVCKIALCIIMFKNTNDYSHGIAIPDFETHL
jgi:hypothetical protein